MAGRRTIAVILNAVSLHQKTFSKSILPELESHHHIEVFSTLRHNHAIELTATVIESGRYEVIFAGGGNGTLNQVIHSIGEFQGKNVTVPDVGIIPLGTANDFAKCLRIRKDSRQILNLLSSRSTKDVNLGKVTFTHGANETGYRYFLNVADAGMGPEVVSKVMETRRTFGPAIQYYKSIIETFFTYKPMMASAKADQWEWQGKLRSFAVANGKYYGNGLCIAPDALLDDNLFNVFISGDVSVVDFIKHSDRLKRGKKVALNDVHYREARHVKLNADRTCLIQADGELLGRLPATIEVIAQKVRLLAPSTSSK